MKATYLYAGGALAISVALAACVSSGANFVAEPEQKVAAAPATAPAPTPTPTPIPAPMPVVDEPTYDNYLDAPQSTGTWVYKQDPVEPIAYFTGSGTAAQFMLVCNKQTPEITIARLNSGLSRDSLIMRVMTETTSRRFTARPSGDYGQLASFGLFVSASLAPDDPLLDAMAITKGRFAVEVEGERTLYLPAWAEVSRVIEDCR